MSSLVLACVAVGLITAVTAWNREKNGAAATMWLVATLSFALAASLSESEIVGLIEGAKRDGVVRAGLQATVTQLQATVTDLHGQLSDQAARDAAAIAQVHQDDAANVAAARGQAADADQRASNALGYADKLADALAQSDKVIASLRARQVYQPVRTQLIAFAQNNPGIHFYRFYSPVGIEDDRIYIPGVRMALLDGGVPVDQQIWMRQDSQAAP